MHAQPEGGQDKKVAGVGAPTASEKKGLPQSDGPRFVIAERARVRPTPGDGLVPTHAPWSSLLLSWPQVSRLSPKHRVISCWTWASSPSSRGGWAARRQSSRGKKRVPSSRLCGQPFEGAGLLLSAYEGCCCPLTSAYEAPTQASCLPAAKIALEMCNRSGGGSSIRRTVSAPLSLLHP